MKWQLRTLVIIAALIFPVSMVQASGFSGPGARATLNRAADVISAHDETPCVLEGRIIEKIPHSKNRYLFEDKSGRTIVEIKNRLFGQSTVTPSNLVRIVGAVDWDGKYPNEVEAQSLEILTPSVQINS